MNGSNQIVLFTLDQVRLGLDLSAVERVIHLVEITPLPGAPEIVLGIINVHGEVVPVIDILKRLGLPPRLLRLQDQLILARTSRRRVALLAGDVVGIVAPSPAEWVSAAHILPNLEPIAGVLTLAGGLVLIQDLDAFLSLDQERQLSQAIEQVS